MEKSSEKISTEKVLSKRKCNHGLYFELFLCVVLMVFIVIPLIMMFTKIDSATLKEIANDSTFLPALGNSFLIAIISSVLSVVIAYGLAWAISRTNIKFKAIFSIIIVLPMLIPTISHGMGLVILFGNNGIITRLFGLSSTILYGYVGIILGSLLYSVPVAYLMFCDILKYENYQTYEAADILGVPKHKQFASITVPYLRKPTISIFFTVFTMILTDYGIPLSVGGKVKTLPVILYEKVVGQLNYSVGAVIGLILLVPTVVAFILDLLNKDKGKSGFVTSKINIRKDKKRDVWGYVICGVCSFFVSLVIISFCVQAFSTSYPNDMSFTLEHFKNTFAKNGLTYLDNSIIMSLFTAFVGVVATFITAYCTARMKTKASKPLHIISLISLAIPGLVLGLSYVITFKSSFIYGTLSMLVIVNSVHFFASPYLMMYSALDKMNQNLESVGQVMNISRFRMICDVIIPQAKSTIIESFSYFFVNSMITISAVSFLSTRINKPLSLMINQFEAFNMIECSAVVALMILTVNMLMKTIIYFIKKGEKKNVRKKRVWCFGLFGLHWWRFVTKEDCKAYKNVGW